MHCLSTWAAPRTGERRTGGSGDVSDKRRTSSAFQPALGAVKITKKDLSAIRHTRFRIGIFTGWIGISTATTGEAILAPGDVRIMRDERPVTLSS
jgi:hypothetical protein